MITAQARLQTVWLSFFLDKGSQNVLFKTDKLTDILPILHCSNYSLTVQNVIIYIVAFSHDAFPEKDKIYNRRKKQQLEIRINADYDRLLQADERETLQIIAETYLKAIEIFLIPRKDFEGKKFYEDVKSLFEKEGILEKIE
jgi:tRNA splicing endonuclease